MQKYLETLSTKRVIHAWSPYSWISARVMMNEHTCLLFFFSHHMYLTLKNHPPSYDVYTWYSKNVFIYHYSFFNYNRWKVWIHDQSEKLTHHRGTVSWIIRICPSILQIREEKNVQLHEDVRSCKIWYAPYLNNTQKWKP